MAVVPGARRSRLPCHSPRAEVRPRRPGRNSRRDRRRRARNPWSAQSTRTRRVRREAAGSPSDEITCNLASTPQHRRSSPARLSSPPRCAAGQPRLALAHGTGRHQIIVHVIELKLRVGRASGSSVALDGFRASDQLGGRHVEYGERRPRRCAGSARFVTTLRNKRGESGVIVRDRPIAALDSIHRAFADPAALTEINGAPAPRTACSPWPCARMRCFT